MFRKIGLTAALVLLGSTTALADTPAQARKAIEAIYNTEIAALSKRDVDSVFAYQTPDYIVVTKAGKHYNREQANQRMRLLTMAKKIVAKSSILSFALKGNTATVKTKSQLLVTFVNSQTNKLASTTVEGVAEDIWVKRGGKWLCRQAKEISQTQKMTGAK